MLKRNIANVAIADVVLGVGAYAWAEGAPARPTTSPPAAALAANGRPGRAGHPGLALLRRAVHGDVIVKDKAGQFVTVTFDRGKVTSHSDSSITVERPDGPSVTLHLDGSTRYRGITSATDIQDGKGAIVVSKDGTAIVVAQRQRGAGNTAADADVERSVDQVPAA